MTHRTLTRVGVWLLTATTAVIASPWGRATPAALSPDSAPALPAPSGTIVNVSTVAQLQAAFTSLSSNSTIVIAPGTYNLTSTLWISGTFANITVRGATNNRDDVVLVGKGMGVSDANVPFGIWAGGNVTGLTIANLTVRDLYEHPIIFNAGTQGPHVYNVHLINAGQQFLKSNPDGAGGGVNNGIVEYSVFEYTDTAPNDYTNAVDVHTGQNWIVRHNLFRRIRAPQGLLAGPAVLMWNSSSGSIVEGNTFIDCQREISMGLIERTPNDHTGGIVRNNFIYRNTGMGGDVGIGVMDSPNTVVANNTILLNGQYPNAIEYRFANTTGVSLVNNLGDTGAQARDGATGTLQNNVWTAAASWFVAPTAGNLHLLATATAAIDKGLSTASAPLDWDNQTRPSGSAFDIGADEYSGGTTTDTTAPAVSITAPSAGATVSGATTISASASDNVGVAGVQFTVDGVNVGSEDPTSPYSTSWTTTGVTNGTHVVRAVARDAAGNSTTSSPVSVTVSNAVPDTTAPTVTVSAPSGGATVKGIVAVSAAAADNVGVAGVKFTLDNVTIGSEDTSAPYSITWTTTSATNGAHSLRAIARDAAGNTTTSAAVSVTVGNTTPDTTAPTVSLTAPAANATVNGAVLVSASASDNVGVVGVQFTLDGANLGTEDTASPFSVTWSTTTAGNGSHVLGAVARDAAGNTKTATLRTVTVSNTTPDTSAPTVNITAPSSGARVSGSITLTASASDNVGVIGVQFKLDGAALGGEDTTAPYQFTWSSAGASNGTHSITATARDAAGNSKTSAAVSITVSNGAQSSVAGDINGDGTPDLWFQHTSGQIYGWFLDGATMVGGGSPNPGTVDPVWRIVASDDFDGDGRSDLLWQNTTTGQLFVWMMNGLTKIGEMQPLPTATPWRVGGSGDFNGDGHADIVWQHPATGQLYVWLMSTTGTRIGEGYLSPSQIDLTWRIAGTADINLDGQTDIVWQNTVTGALKVWYMNGLTATASVDVAPSSVSVAWALRDVADFDSDGHADFLFQNVATGQMYVWFMNGVVMRSGSYLTPSQTALPWQLVGGR